MRVVEVPEVVRRTAEHAGATDWLGRLPILIEDLERDWQIVVGPPFGGGTQSYVAEARLDDGTEAVLKLHMPRDPRAVQDELRALRLAQGVGCARLLRGDADRGAALLERLGRPLSELRLPIGRRHEILCATAQQFWRPAPASGLRSGADQAERLSALVRDQWEALDRPCTERVVGQALAAAARRSAAHDEARAVLVHGDVHQWNTLEAAAGFKLVDPDGLHAEAEYDLGIIMREDPLELIDEDPRARAARLAHQTGLDPVAIWEWGILERVSNGLLCLADGLTEAGQEALQAAEWAARFEVGSG